MEIKITVRSVKEMEKFAKKFYKTLHGGEIILLNGDLGAGKTTFTKYFCKAGKVKEEVTSPTFTIMREYQGKPFHIIHFDLYRIEQTQEVQEFGFEDYVYAPKKKDIVLIEWPYNLPDFIYPDCYELQITKLGETERLVTLTKRGNV